MERCHNCTTEFEAKDVYSECPKCGDKPLDHYHFMHGETEHEQIYYNKDTGKVSLKFGAREEIHEFEPEKILEKIPKRNKLYVDWKYWYCGDNHAKS